jgi:hypothetical protein
MYLSGLRICVEKGEEGGKESLAISSLLLCILLGILLCVLVGCWVAL